MSIDTRDNSQHDWEDLKEEKPLIYWITRGMILAVVIAIIITLIVFRDPLGVFLSEFCTWVGENPIYGSICLAIVYAVSVVLFVPAALLTAASGWAF